MTRLLALLASLTLACTTSSAVHVDSPPASPVVDRLVDFDPQQGQLPEGLAIAGDTSYVGFAPTGVVARVDLTNGTTQAWGKLPTPVAGKGFMTGLAEDDGEVLAALVSFVPDVQAGVYRIPAGGGDAELFASSPAMPFPNAIAKDGDAWFVTDSTGKVFRITAGTATVWSQDELLAGNKDACGTGIGPGFDIGANGLVVEPDALYVVNTDKATLIRIARAADGSAGAASVVVGPDCDNLGGADGLVRDGDGFLIAVNRQNKISRVSANGTVSLYAASGTFDFPASLARSGSRWIGTNFAFANAVAGTSPRPGLFTLTPGQH